MQKRKAAGRGKNLALKVALWESGLEQQEIARRARIAPQDLSHAISRKRELDDDEKDRLVAVLAKRGVECTVAGLFGAPTEQHA